MIAADLEASRRVTANSMQQRELWQDQGEPLPWSVRQSARARRLSVRIFRSGGVEIVVPPRTSAGRVRSFVHDHWSWIERHRQQVQQALARWPMPPQELALTGIGEHWRCVPQPHPGGRGRRVVVMTRQDTLLLQGGCDEPGLLRRALMHWLGERARCAFDSPLRALAAQMQVTPGALQVRWQRTRWGSCSRRKTISLNACLLFQTPQVLRYLMVHELAHLRHMNHSARFWADVAQFEPCWSELDRQLLDGWQRVPGWLLQ